MDSTESRSPGLSPKRAAAILAVLGGLSAIAAAQWTYYLKAEYFSRSFITSKEAPRLWVPLVLWLLTILSAYTAVAVWRRSRGTLVSISLLWLATIGAVIVSYTTHHNGRATIWTVLTLSGIFSYLYWKIAQSVRRLKQE